MSDDDWKRRDARMRQAIMRGDMMARAANRIDTIRIVSTFFAVFAFLGAIKLLMWLG